MLSDPLIFCLFIYAIYRNYHSEFAFTSLFGAVNGFFIGVFIAAWFGSFFGIDHPISDILLVAFGGLAGAEKGTSYMIKNYFENLQKDEQKRLEKEQAKEAKKAAKVQKRVAANQGRARHREQYAEFEETQDYDGFASAQNKRHHARAKSRRFNKSRFTNSRTASQYQQWEDLVNNPSASRYQRIQAVKKLAAADNGEVDGIKALPAPRG